MTSVLSMLQRVRKLEQARAAPLSPFEAAFGSFAAFEEQTLAEVQAGKLDARDMPVVLHCLRKWHADRVWSGPRRNSGYWENTR